MVHGILSGAGAGDGGGGGSPTGAAGGDLSGTYPNPEVTGAIEPSSVVVANAGGDEKVAIQPSTPAVNLASDVHLKFYNNSDIGSGAAVVGIKQVAGVLTRTDGGAGTSGSFIAGASGAVDNAVLRADGTGGASAQASAAVLDDAGALSGLTQLDVDNLRLDGNTISSTSGNVNVTTVSGGAVMVTATGNSLMEFNITGNQVMYFKTQNTNRWTIDANGNLTSQASTIRVNARHRTTKTSTAAAATTTEYPNDGDFGVHHNTATGARHFVFNDGGTLYSVQLL